LGIGPHRSEIFGIPIYPQTGRPIVIKFGMVTKLEEWPGFRVDHDPSTQRGEAPWAKFLMPFEAKL